MAAPEVRTIRWRPLLAIVPVSFLIVYAGTHDPGQTKTLHIPLAGMALAVWAGFLFEDPAASTVRGAPTPVFLRRGVRVLLVLPVFALGWAGLMWYANVWDSAGSLTTQFAAQISVALSLGAVGVVAVGDDRAGLFAAAGLFLVFIATPLLMRGGILSPTLVNDTWAYMYGRWIVTCAVAFALTLLAGRDPAVPGARAHLRARGLSIDHSAV